MTDNPQKVFSGYVQIEVDNLADWTHAVLKMQEGEQSTWVALGEVFGDKKWLFRGQSNAAWPIASSLERMNRVPHNHLRDPERYFRAIERFSIEEFKRQAHSQIKDDNLTNLEWTMLMRHHGVPTRLVDFTEVPLLALFFALENDSSDDFAVWAVARNEMCDWYVNSEKAVRIPDYDKLVQKYSPAQLNEMLARNENDVPELRPVLDFFRKFKKTADNVYKRIFENRQFAERIFSADIDEVLPDVDKLPALYLYTEKPNARQRVQRALFLMSTRAASPFMVSLKKSLGIVRAEIVRLNLSELSSDTKSIEKFLVHAKLIQFVFKNSLRKECRDLFRFAGLTPSSVYPDLSGVSSEVTDRISQGLSPTYDITDIVRKQLPEIMAGKPIPKPNGPSNNSSETEKRLSNRKKPL